MTDEIDVKVVVQNSFLQGANDSDALQRIATVYIDGSEYRVWAPPQAKGDALDWERHFLVTQLGSFNSEEEVRGSLGVLVRKSVTEELQKAKRRADRALGEHPDGLHCDAQICLRGHVQYCDGTLFESEAFCSKCGARCIDECTRCGEPIRGSPKFQPASTYNRPQYCHKCGRPYPWMEDRLQTAKELLYHDDKLLQDDRERLWELLQYVMSDPKSDLVPAKNKRIEINLGKATAMTREFVTDLMTKYLAEMSKP